MISMRALISTVAALVAFSALSACAQMVPTAITYQGRLTNTEGKPLPDGSYDAMFAMYDSQASITPFWTLSTQITTSQGVFTTVLSNLDPAKLVGKKETWLEISINKQKPLPRIMLTSVPFALRAGSMDIPFAGSTSSVDPAISISNSVGPALQATGNVNLKGKMGIGTTSPQFPLDVNGIIRSSTGGVQFPDGSVQTKAGITGSGTGGYVPYWVDSNIVGMSKLFQDSYGDVGIGMTNPSGSLTVNSNIQNLYPGFPSIILGNPDGTSLILIGKDSNKYTAFGWSSFSENAVISTTSTLVIQCSATNGGVGINTYTPDEKLTVKGSVKIDCGNENNGDLTKGAVKFGLGNTGEGIASKRTSGGNQYGLDFYTCTYPRLSITNGGNVGVGINNPSYNFQVNGTVAGSGPYIALSDSRFKTNIQPLTGALSKVMNLRGVSFKWKTAENPELKLEQGTQIGFIAQEIEKVLPETVRIDGSGKRAVAYSEVIPVLVEAIKEQQKTIDEMTLRKDAQIADLQRQINELKLMLTSAQEKK